MKHSTFLLVIAGALGACGKDNVSQAAQSATRPTTPAATPAPAPVIPLTDPNVLRTPVKQPELSSEMRDTDKRDADRRDTDTRDTDTRDTDTRDTDKRDTDQVGMDATHEDSDRSGQAGLSDALTQPGLPTPGAIDGTTAGTTAPKDLSADAKIVKPKAAALPKDAALPLGAMDQEFVTKAPNIGLFAVEASELAVLQATTPFVREFAQMLVVDHEDANRELDEIVRGKGTTSSKELDSEHQSRLTTLRSKQGVDFDRQYRDLLVSEHNDAIALFDRAASDCEDTELKAFAAKWLPTLRAHQAKLSEMPPTSGS